MNTKENILLDEIEELEEYSEMEEMITETLEDQWLDLVSSWVIEDVYSEVKGTVPKNKPIARALALYVAWASALQYKKIFKWVNAKVSSKVRRSGYYSRYWIETKKYLLDIFNRWGQAELDKYLWKWTLAFSLTHKLMRDNLKLRTETLYKDWSKTTADRFTRELIKGLKNNDSRNQIVNKIVGVNESIAKERAEKITLTETAASLEYGRYMTALMNGVEWKIWTATLDERTSTVCRNTNWETIPIDAVFSCWVEHPPAHVHCRSHLEYLYDDYSDIEKKKKPKAYIFYPKTKWLNAPKGLNKEYIWTGGNSYQWKDKDMDSYIGLFQKKDYTQFNKVTLEALAKKVEHYDSDVLLDVNLFRRQVELDAEMPIAERINIVNKPDNELAVIMAKAKLTWRGFEQLLHKV